MPAKATSPKTGKPRSSKSKPPPVAPRSRTASPRRASPPVPVPKVPESSPKTAPGDLKLTRIVYQKILGAIVSGPLDLGEPLSENDLARALGVSKAPVREALNELRLEGLVVVVPQSGSYVFRPTSEQIQELCEFRSLLETRALLLSMGSQPRPLVAELRRCAREMKRAFRNGDLFASKCLDTDFHRAIIRRSGNQYLVQSYAKIGHSVEALRHRFMDAAIYRNQAFDEHQKIVDLLAGDQVSKATSVLKDHIARTKHFHAGVSWSTSKLRRKDYRFRDYSTIFAGG